MWARLPHTRVALEPYFHATMRGRAGKQTDLRRGAVEVPLQGRPERGEQQHAVVRVPGRHEAVVQQEVVVVPLACSALRQCVSRQRISGFENRVGHCGATNAAVTYAYICATLGVQEMVAFS